MPKRLPIALLTAWPGLAQIWTGQEVLGLILAAVFAATLNLAIVSRFLWTEAFAAGPPRVLRHARRADLAHRVRIHLVVALAEASRATSRGDRRPVPRIRRVLSPGPMGRVAARARTPDRARRDGRRRPDAARLDLSEDRPGRPRPRHVPAVPRPRVRPEVEVGDRPRHRPNGRASAGRNRDRGVIGDETTRAFVRRRVIPDARRPRFLT